MPDKDDVSQPLLKEEASTDLDREVLVPPRQRRRLLHWLAAAVVVSVVIEGAVVNHVRPEGASLAGNLKTCAPQDAVTSKAPRISESRPSCAFVYHDMIGDRSDLWKNLSVKEAGDLKKWLSYPARDLNFDRVRTSSRHVSVE